jgi:hypothetical protein
VKGKTLQNISLAEVKKHKFIEVLQLGAFLPAPCGLVASATQPFHPEAYLPRPIEAISIYWRLANANRDNFGKNLPRVHNSRNLG